MKAWLYKARDVAANGDPRPDAETTRAFAINDGILCRSAYTRSDDRSAWIPNVQYVEAGDILLFFFRQVTSQPAILFLGSFRVRDPGATRLNEECDLAVVQEADLAARLRGAYGIPPGEPVTGWLLDPASDVIAPGESEPEIAEFLSRRSSLVEYHRRLQTTAQPTPKPSGNMGIRRVEIRGFRSLRAVSWEPGRLNVVLGPNGSGKSNLLRALALLQSSAQGDLGQAILRMGGMTPLLWDGQVSQISWAVDTAPLSDDPAEGLTYELLLEQLGSTSSFRVGRETLSHLSLRGAARQSSVLLDREGISAITRDSPPGRPLAREGSIPEDQSMLSAVVAPFFDPAALSFREALRGWSIYHDLRVDPQAPLRQAAVARVEPRVSPDGQNLIPVLHTLYTGDPEFRRSADAAMSAAFGDDYVGLVFPPAADQRVQLRVRWSSLNTEQSAAALSDGTLRLLLLIAILANPAPGTLIAIDEPEAGLHPRMYPIVAELALQASDRAQVVLTTHSPQLLDAFADEPPTTTVAQSIDGETRLSVIDGEELRRWLTEYSLGALFRSGELEGDGMKFVLFVEGYTEQKALPDLLRAWLEPPRLPERVGVQVVRFEGWAQYYKDIPDKVSFHLSGKRGEEVIAAIGLLDLYGPTFYPPDRTTAAARYTWAKQHIEARVAHARFRQHFAIHETEAWLLSDPKIFPREVQGAFPGKCSAPETVNFDEPPAKLLERLYQARLKRRYQKVLDGHRLFKALPHEIARAKCPSLRHLLDDMLGLARGASN